MKPQIPLVSIIVVNYNGKELLKVILKSIKKLKFNHSFETIVVDNNSSDASIDFIKNNYEEVSVVKNNKNLGYSGVNSALKHCKGEYIFFLNNDMRLDGDCLQKLYDCISDENIAMAAPRLINYYDSALKSNGTWVSRSFYCGHIKYERSSAKNKNQNGKEKLKITKDIPYLGVGLIKKDFVKKFGYLFDPDYFIYGEDLDLGLRIRASGTKTVFVGDAILYHMHSATMQRSSSAKKIFFMERNLLITFFKIMTLENILLFLPYVAGIRVTAIIKDIFTFKFANASARIKAIIWVVFYFNIVIGKRKETQKLRRTNDDFILKVFSEKCMFKQAFVV